MEATPAPLDTLQKTAVVARRAKGEELDEVSPATCPDFTGTPCDTWAMPLTQRTPFKMQ
jgi:hypothetical protein